LISLYWDPHEVCLRPRLSHRELEILGGRTFLSSSVRVFFGILCIPAFRPFPLDVQHTPHISSGESLKKPTQTVTFFFLFLRFRDVIASVRNAPSPQAFFDAVDTFPPSLATVLWAPRLASLRFFPLSRAALDPICRTTFVHFFSGRLSSRVSLVRSALADICVLCSRCCLVSL